jgi:class 3 adenylate cyclase
VLPWREDHAARAVLAAGDILRALDDYNDICQSTFKTRVGINSGSVVAGVLGTSQVRVR